jgi:hypothetical protein
MLEAVPVQHAGLLAKYHVRCIRRCMLTALLHGYQHHSGGEVASWHVFVRRS